MWDGLEEGYATLPSGVKLHYVAQGAGPLVVMLHGFPEHWYSWRKQIPALVQQGFRVVAPDMRGYNLSDKPREVEDYNVEHLAADVAALIEALGQEQAIVVGHDWGGVAAWFTAMRHPERVARLVVLNMPHPYRFAESWKTLRQRLRSAYFYFFRLRRLAAFSFRLFGALGQRLMLWWFSGRKITSAELRHYARAGLEPGAMLSMMTYYTALLRRSPDQMMHLVAPIHCEVRVIWGDRDPAFGKDLATPRPEHVAPERLQVRFIEGAGHFVQSERPDEVTQALLAAL